MNNERVPSRSKNTNNNTNATSSSHSNNNYNFSANPSGYNYNSEHSNIIYNKRQNNKYNAKMGEEDGPQLGAGKTLLILAVVGVCFALLWPKLFYPMLMAGTNQQMKPGPIDNPRGCCDVISDTDVNTIKLMSELCSTIIIIQDRNKTKRLDKEDLLASCRQTVLAKCGIDLSAVLQEKVSLGQSVKQILEEIRSLNGSMCLKYNFGVPPWRLGVVHRITVKLNEADSIRQERSSQLRSEMIHPAFREKGRAIPMPDVVKRANPPPRIVEGRPGPIPGMRPTMGGAGHVVPTKQSSGLTGLLLPLYTIAIVIFFGYTVMKLSCKKKKETYVGAPLYPQSDPDENFRKEVFRTQKCTRTIYKESPNSKLVVNAVTALIEEIDQELQARESCRDDDVDEDDDDNYIQEENTDEDIEKEEEPSVRVVGMEMRASYEEGQKWAKHDPLLMSKSTKKQNNVAQEQPSAPQEFFLDKCVPPESQLLVTDSATETQRYTENDHQPAVVLAGKMTLSVISPDTIDSSTTTTNQQQKEDEVKHGEQTKNGTKPSDIDIVEEIRNELDIADDLIKVLQLSNAAETNNSEESIKIQQNNNNFNNEPDENQMEELEEKTGENGNNYDDSKNNNQWN